MSPGIAHILCAGAFAQIGDAVIPALVVDVIDLPARVLAVDMKPSEPMRAINDPTNSDVAISLPGPVARFAVRGCAAASHPPIKTPRVRGVIEQLPQALGRQLAFQFAEHEVSQKKSARADRGSGRNSPFQVFLGDNGTLFAPVFADGAHRWCNSRLAASKKRAHKRKRCVVF
jgi:hypothetical protein